MKSPLYNALSEHIEKHRERLHMPGHKGLLPFPLSQCAPFDLTEVPDTGCLYDGEGAPVKTEEEFSSLYSSGATLLSAGGSTLCIQTMLSLFCREGSQLLMSRSAHHAAVNAAALLGLKPVWLLPDLASGVLTGGRISAQSVERALAENRDISAIYITSPDYFGTLCDIRAIAEVCKKYKKPLLVDNAHGAHLKFFKGLHAMELGADACCDSLHKTLPALTGAALLHLKEKRLKDEARRRMKHFGSTSPSYLIMLSCDMLLPRWSDLNAEFNSLAEQAAHLRQAAIEKGVWALEQSELSDPVRISLLFPEGKRSETIELLYSLNIEAEYISNRHIVLIPSPQNNLQVIKNLIRQLPPQHEKPILRQLELPQSACTLRAAILSEAERIDTKQAVGRICSNPAAPCPPGTAIIMPGERIDKALCQALLASGINEISVIKQ